MFFENFEHALIYGHIYITPPVHSFRHNTQHRQAFIIKSTTRYKKNSQLLIRWLLVEKLTLNTKNTQNAKSLYLAKATYCRFRI